MTNVSIFNIDATELQVREKEEDSLLCSVSNAVIGIRKLPSPQRQQK
jgi:hypothetical protein